MVMMWRKERLTGGGRWRENGDGGTHSKQDGLDWHACGPSAPSGLQGFFWIAQTHSCLFCYPLRVLPHRARRPQCKQEHIHTHTDTQTHLSKRGWVERESGEGGEAKGTGAQAFISGGMLLVSRDTHFTYSQNQMDAPMLSPQNTSLAHWIFSSTLIYHPFLPAPSIPSPSIFRFLTSRQSFSCRGTPTLTVALTLSLLSAIPLCPHVTPICVSCMFCDSETIFSSSSC